MFKGWDNVFMLLGTAAASLIGLLFVVVTLTSGLDRTRAMRGTSIYMTPTAVNFAAVLVVAALALAPGLTAPTQGLLVGAVAIVGMGNAVRAFVGIWGLSRADDPPHWTDLWCYGAGPSLAHFGLAGAAAALYAGLAWAADAVAVASMAIMLVAIRNAWDLVTWMAPARAETLLRNLSNKSADGFGAVAGDQAGADRQPVGPGEQGAGEAQVDQRQGDPQP